MAMFDGKNETEEPESSFERPEDDSSNEGGKEGDEKEGGKKKKSKGQQLVNRGAMLMAAKGASTAAKGAMLMSLKMMLQGLLNALMSAASAVGSFFASIVSFVGTILGVSTAIAGMVALGAVGVLIAVVVTVVVAVSSAGDAAQRDVGNPCDEEFKFEYTPLSVTADTMDAAKKVYYFFKQRGFTDTNIAGILGNWDVESGIDPTQVEHMNATPGGWEKFSDLSVKTEANYKNYKVFMEEHEACQCEWLVAMIAKGYMDVIDTAPNGDPIRYKYNQPDPDFDDQGNKITITDREFAYCWTCSDGYNTPCSHGYTESHYTTTGVLCPGGSKHECDHGFIEPHHIPAYHAIDTRTRCLDYEFTPNHLYSDGNEDGFNDDGNLEWIYADDDTFPFYDKEDGKSEGYRKYSTSSNYHTVYCGLGLGQWTDGRNKLLRVFAANHGVNWWELDTQLAFMVAEDGDARMYRNLLDNWKEEPNPQQAAKWFAEKWEGNTKAATNDRQVRAATWYLTISEWTRNGEHLSSEAVDYANSVIGMAGAAAADATNAAAGRQLDSCDKFINADNSSAARAAISFSWATKDQAQGNDGTALWQCVKDAVIGANDGNGMDWKYKSCDRTVASAIRWSGTDDDFPAGDVSTQKAYMVSHPEKWQKIPWDGNKETPLPGDVLIHVSASSQNHVIMYIGLASDYMDSPVVQEGIAAGAYTERDTLIVDGSLGTRSPSVHKFESSSLGTKVYDCYRCVSPSGGSYTGIGCAGLP